MTTIRTRVDPVTGVTTENPAIRDFAAIIMELDDGRLHRALSEDLWDLTRAVEEVRKPGALTLTITMKPVNSDDTTIVAVLGESKLKLPVTSTQPTIAYVDEQGNITSTNPNQPQLVGLRAIITDGRETRP